MKRWGRRKKAQNNSETTQMKRPMFRPIDRVKKYKEQQMTNFQEAKKYFGSDEESQTERLKEQTDQMIRKLVPLIIVLFLLLGLLKVI